MFTHSQHSIHHRDASLYSAKQDLCNIFLSVSVMKDHSSARLFSAITKPSPEYIIVRCAMSCRLGHCSFMMDCEFAHSDTLQQSLWSGECFSIPPTGWVTDLEQRRSMHPVPFPDLEFWACSHYNSHVHDTFWCNCSLQDMKAIDQYIISVTICVVHKFSVGCIIIVGVGSESQFSDNSLSNVLLVSSEFDSMCSSWLGLYKHVMYCKQGNLTLCYV